MWIFSALLVSLLTALQLGSNRFLLIWAFTTFLLFCQSLRGPDTLIHFYQIEYLIALEESWISRDTTFVNSFLNGLLEITGLSVGI